MIYTRNSAITSNWFKVRKIVFRKTVPRFVRHRLQSFRNKSIYKDYYLYRKVIFIHIPKVAGQAISISLFNDKHPGHWFYRDFQWEDMTKSKDYFTFSFVRNPYDRLVSAYFYLKDLKRSGADAIFRDAHLNKYSTFDEFVKYGLERREIITWIHFIPQVEFLKNNDGEILIDRIAKFEEISKEYDMLRTRLGFGEALTKINSSKRLRYKDYYNSETINIVKKIYSEDFSKLGYNE